MSRDKSFQNIRNFLQTYPWIKESLGIYPIENQEKALTQMSYFHQELGILMIGYPTSNPEWLFHELGHIASLLNHQDLYKNNYGLPISNQYTKEELRRELTVFAHQITLVKHFGSFNSKTSQGSIKRFHQQMEESFVGTDKDKLRLKNISANFFIPYDLDFTMNRLKFHLTKVQEKQTPLMKGMNKFRPDYQFVSEPKDYKLSIIDSHEIWESNDV